MVEDLTNLSPKRLERRLEQLAREALPFVAANVFDGNPRDGLTVGLWVESQSRRDVLDLARVLASEPSGHVSTGWSLLAASRSHAHWRLLLQVTFERPVACSFAVRFDVRDDPSDYARAALPLFLAASGFAVGFNSLPKEEDPVVWIPAPTARGCLFEVFAAPNS